MKSRVICLAFFLAISAPLMHAQATRNAAADNEVHVLPVQGNIYMLVAGGSNVTVQSGDDGVLLVDAGNAAMSDKILAAIHGINTGNLNYIVDTDENPEHTGGNAKIALTGSPVGFHNITGPGRGAGGFGTGGFGAGGTGRRGPGQGRPPQQGRQPGAQPRETGPGPGRDSQGRGPGSGIVVPPEQPPDQP